MAAESRTNLPAQAVEGQKADVSFLCSYCNIDESEARARVKATQEAVASAGHHAYRCIERAMFTVSRVHTHTDYPSVVKRFADADFKLLELGCCFGTDARQMLHDGLDPSKLVVSDLLSFYWETGSSVLFRDDMSTVESHFLDFADASFAVLGKPAEWEQAFDVISAQAILHVLSEEQCTTFLRHALHCLKPGCGMLLGTCVGATEAVPSWGETPTKGLPGRKKETRYLHSVESLTALLLRLGFTGLSVYGAGRPMEAVGLGAQEPNRDTQPAGPPHLETLAYISFRAIRP